MGVFCLVELLLSLQCQVLRTEEHSLQMVIVFLFRKFAPTILHTCLASQVQQDAFNHLVSSNFNNKKSTLY